MCCKAFLHLWSTEIFILGEIRPLNKLSLSIVVYMVDLITVFNQMDRSSPSYRWGKPRFRREDQEVLIQGSHLSFFHFGTFLCDGVFNFSSCHEAPQMDLLKQQTFIFSQFWRLSVQDQGVGRLAFSWGLFPRLTDGHFLTCPLSAFPLPSPIPDVACVLIFLQGQKEGGIQRTHCCNDFIWTWSPLLKALSPATLTFWG